MSLTENQKQRIIEAQKGIAKYQFEIRQLQLENIKKKFNDNLIKSLKKGNHHKITETIKDAK